VFSPRSELDHRGDISVDFIAWDLTMQAMVPGPWGLLQSSTALVPALQGMGAKVWVFDPAGMEQAERIR